MSGNDSGLTVRSSDLEEGDEVVVEVNNRARRHLGTSRFEATVESVMFEDIQFKRTETGDLHTWYSDIGYIHGYHTGLERHSDIGKVLKVERND